MAASLETRNLVGSALAVLLLGAAFFSVSRYMDQTSAAVVERSHMGIALRALDRSLSDLKDAETGQRGFLLTGRPEYLAPYESGRREAEAGFKAFPNLPGAKDLPREDLEALRALAMAKLDELDRTVRLVQAGKREEALAIVAAGDGLRTMGQLRAEHQRLAAELEQRRKLQDEHVADARWRTRLALCGFGGLALLSMAASLWALHRDIRSRAESERALAESEAKFRALADHAPVGIFEMDLTGHRPYINEALCRFAGLSYDEAFTKGFRHRIHPEDLDRVLAQWERTRASGDPSILEYRFVLPDGAVRWVESRAAPVPGPDGRIQSFVGIVVDRTEQLRVQEELKASERRFRTLAESAPVGIYELDLVRGTVYANDEHCRLTGVPREEGSRQRFRDSVHPEDAPRILEQVGADMREGLPFEQIYRLLHPDGTVVWVHSRGTPVEDPPGRVMSYLIVSQDFTELRAKTTALETANKELEAFAYSVSHDLRAPLRHIDGFVGLLRRSLGDEVSERAKHQLDIISGSARQMGALIDDLLAFSRMGRTEVHRTRFDLGALVRRVMDELAPDAAGREIEWRVGPLPSVDGDPALLRLVLLNLVGNALKFTRGRSPARIEISASTAAGATALTVRDNGAGFDMRYADKLFGVFQRLHRQEEFEGTGIGLANVARIIQKHGGTVAAEGAVGAGATFTFTLPAAAPAPLEVP